MAERLRGVEWIGRIDGHLRLIDQTRLPREIVYRDIRDPSELRQAIVDLVVRGAPAIGIAAAYGMVLGLHRAAREQGIDTCSGLEDSFEDLFASLNSSRPTAVNLRWALERQRHCFEHHAAMLSADEMLARLLMEARRIEQEDVQLCQRIAEHGAALLPASGGVYTHCNTGSMATAGVGTALGCIRQAIVDGKKLNVVAGETRPLLQGARLTVLELQHEGIPVHLCCDNAAGHIMQSGAIQAVIVGADRITANGDAANKIGTYSLAVLARHHDIPFYVAAPYSTFDTKLASGSDIVIEERSADEVRRPFGTQFAPLDIPVANPAFDVTPASLISAIITERGVIETPDTDKVLALMQDGPSTPAV